MNDKMFEVARGEKEERQKHQKQQNSNVSCHKLMLIFGTTAWKIVDHNNNTE